MNKKEEKRALLERLYEPYKKCLMCPLGFLGRTSVVFGHGNPDAQYMIIGEAPGREEDEKGLPFIGKSGRFLTTILNKVGVKREDIFITNSVKCRPPQNRKPTQFESTTCKDLLLINQINIIQPKAICTLGATALETLLGTPVKITQVRGKILSFNSIFLFPTYHPAYIMRNMTKLDEYILDFQNYFSTF